MSVTSKQYFTQLNLFFFSLAGGQAIFALIAFYLRKKGMMEVADPDLGRIFLGVGLALSVLGILLSRYLYQKKLEAISQENLRRKMNEYRAAFILQLALLEGPALFCMVTYLISGTIWLLLLGVGMLMFFLLQYPSLNRVSNDLALEPHERTQLEDPNSIIADSPNK